MTLLAVNSALGSLPSPCQPKEHSFQLTEQTRESAGLSPTKENNAGVTIDPFGLVNHGGGDGINAMAACGPRTPEDDWEGVAPLVRAEGEGLGMSGKLSQSICVSSSGGIKNRRPCREGVCSPETGAGSGTPSSCTPAQDGTKNAVSALGFLGKVGLAARFGLRVSLESKSSGGLALDITSGGVPLSRTRP